MELLTSSHDTISAGQRLVLRVRVATKKTSTKGQKKIAKVMHEFKQGELKSGGRKKVKNPKQAIAIALSEAREAGAKIPRKGASAKKKTATKRPAAKKTSARKKSTRKSSK
jgi:hypothetical protein